MTVIIALKHKGINYIAADRRVSAGSDIINDNADKIIKHNNCLIGTAGGVAEAGLLERILNDNKDLEIKSKEDVLSLYLKLRILSKEHDLIEVGDIPGIERLFVTDKKIRWLLGNGAVLEINKYACVGCGADYAIGLLANATINNPEKDLKDIIKKVSKYSSGVSSNSLVKVPLSNKIVKKINKKPPIK